MGRRCEHWAVEGSHWSCDPSGPSLLPSLAVILGVLRTGREREPSGQRKDLCPAVQSAAVPVHASLGPRSPVYTQWADSFSYRLQLSPEVRQMCHQSHNLSTKRCFLSKRLVLPFPNLEATGRGAKRPLM